MIPPVTLIFQRRFSTPFSSPLENSKLCGPFCFSHCLKVISVFMTDGILLAVRRVTLIPDSLRASLSCTAFFFSILEYFKAYVFSMQHTQAVCIFIFHFLRKYSLLMNFGFKILKSSINKYFWSPLKSVILVYHIYFSENNRTEKKCFCS